MSRVRKSEEERTGRFSPEGMVGHDALSLWTLRNLLVICFFQDKRSVEKTTKPNKNKIIISSLSDDKPMFDGVFGIHSHKQKRSRVRAERLANGHTRK